MEDHDDFDVHEDDADDDFLHNYCWQRYKNAGNTHSEPHMHHGDGEIVVTFGYMSDKNAELLRSDESVTNPYATQYSIRGTRFAFHRGGVGISESEYRLDEKGALVGPAVREEDKVEVTYGTPGHGYSLKNYPKKSQYCHVRNEYVFYQEIPEGEDRDITTHGKHESSWEFHSRVSKTTVIP